MNKGKVALVTGASRGAGAGIARGLGELGYPVYVTGRTVTPGARAFVARCVWLAAGVSADSAQAGDAASKAVARISGRMVSRF